VVEGRGQVPRIPARLVKTKAVAKFRLQCKYKVMHLVDKNPDDEEDELPEGEWEHRVIANRTHLA
jgi:hypothetical protein